MGNVINLKRFRKGAERESLEKQAQANRVRFGRNKVERTLEEKRANRAKELLEQHRIEHGETP